MKFAGDELVALLVTIINGAQILNRSGDPLGGRRTPQRGLKSETPLVPLCRRMERVTAALAEKKSTSVARLYQPPQQAIAFPD
jgi:hypothetical protein